MLAGGQGRHSYRLLDRPGRWHSQVAQDRAVVHLLNGRRGGYFIDLASNHPLLNSNSRTLERDFGWHGLCIEPNEDYWPLYARIGRSCELVGEVIGGTREAIVRFRRAEGEGVAVGLSTEAGDISNSSFASDASQRLAVPFATLLRSREEPTTIDYLSLDVEGSEAKVMATFPFSSHTISVLTVERPRRALRTLLARKGYKYVCTSGWFGDALYVHNVTLGARVSHVWPWQNSTSTHCAGFWYAGGRTEWWRARQCERLLDPSWVCPSPGHKYHKPMVSVSNAAIRS